MTHVELSCAPTEWEWRLVLAPCGSLKLVAAPYGSLRLVILGILARYGSLRLVTALYGSLKREFAGQIAQYMERNRYDDNFISNRNPPRKRGVDNFI